ncbi:peptidoglycan-associated lipoprotein Pal [Aliiglaciecola sp. CAU 1673]|uniref:peptidoglycan-associated lipoprotein Pal n=1 Tax=Aliiglaciecola sp. CAU 1673 TaxID=3032595 RepID=UPI0023D9CCBD|nr:peptidoglycan-associated lipoprotein Pal [Aliiglaciecola sp. CAU 1673]MDF2177203.1 peptidoglycan-associated lipoprotein Pal [Aliiglaciecola sp. CAU 1673]
MQFSKVFKGIVVALPIVTLMACSSSSQVDDQASTNQDDYSTIQTGPVERVRTAEELMREEMNSLRNEQVIFFDFDRSVIRSEFFPILDKHAAFLIKNPSLTVTVEGHTDSRGTPEYNIALGERRAKSVATYLQNAGVSAMQISVVSYGEEKPAAMGSDESAMSQNRRGVLVYR